MNSLPRPRPELRPVLETRYSQHCSFTAVEDLESGGAILFVRGHFVVGVV